LLTYLIRDTAFYTIPNDSFGLLAFREYCIKGRFHCFSLETTVEGKCTNHERVGGEIHPTTATAIVTGVVTVFANAPLNENNYIFVFVIIIIVIIDIIIIIIIIIIFRRL